MLNNAIIHVNPQAYLGRYGVSGAGGIQSSGPRDFVVVPALTYTVQLNYPAPGSFTFDVDALGAVSTTSTAAHGTVDTLVFNNTILRVDPDGYSGTYNIQQLQSAVPSLSGIRDFVLLPGISVYKVGSGGVGNPYSQFGLDATGHPTPTTIPVTTGEHTYVFSLAYIAPNSPPLANPDNGAVSEDSTGNVIDVLANDTDADNLPPTPANAGLTVTAVGAANHGTVSLVGGIVTYTPVANYYGSDNFNYTISDSTGLTSTANVSLTVTNVQDAPVAANDAATVSEDSTGKVIDVLANDMDADNLPPTPANAGLTVTAVGAANHGTVSLVGGVVTYTPGIGCGDASDSFTYTVRDASGLTSTAVVSISIIQYVGVSRADGILRVGGGAGVDVVTVSGGNLIVNGVLHSLTGVDEVRVWGRGGNDQIDLSGLSIKTFVDGGDENDTLTGGSAEDLILGGVGDDTITGAAGNDLLVSGTGRDRIVGSAGNDILVAGDVDCGLGIPALRAISQAWASSQPVDNNSVDDFIDEAVGDADGDKLTGSSGADLFIIGSEDTITDFQFGTPKTNKDGDVVIRDGNVAA